MNLLSVQKTIGYGLALSGHISLLIPVIGVILLLAAGLYFLVFRRGKKRSTGAVPHKANASAYDVPSLVKAVERLSGRPRTILLAASSVTELPVTVPVNLAIQMARTGKCLLIDLDLQRDSVAKVFESDANKADTNFYVSSLPTSIDNLFIWPAVNFEKSRQMNLGTILREAQKKYDCILLYAPYLPTLADRKQIAGCVKYALVFGSTTGKDDRLSALLKTSKCTILQPA